MTTGRPIKHVTLTVMSLVTFTRVYWLIGYACCYCEPRFNFIVTEIPVQIQSAVGTMSVLTAGDRQ